METHFGIEKSNFGNISGLVPQQHQIWNVDNGNDADVDKENSNDMSGGFRKINNGHSGSAPSLAGGLYEPNSFESIQVATVNQNNEPDAELGGIKVVFLLN